MTVVVEVSMRCLTSSIDSWEAELLRRNKGRVDLHESLQSSIRRVVPD